MALRYGYDRKHSTYFSPLSWLVACTVALEWHRDARAAGWSVLTYVI